MMSTTYAFLGAFTVGFMYHLSRTYTNISGDNSHHIEISNEESHDNSTIDLLDYDTNDQPNLEPRKIEVISTIAGCRHLVNDIKTDIIELKVLGFDCEWVPAALREVRKRSKVATLQLCTHRSRCALIQLKRLRIIPEELKDILEDGTIVKVGVNPQLCAQKLRIDFAVRMNGTLDVRHMARRTRASPTSLKRMAARYLGIQSTNRPRSMNRYWNYPNLPERNLRHAVEEAFFGIELFKYFQRECQQDSENPFRFHEDLLNTPFKQYLLTNAR